MPRYTLEGLAVALIILWLLGFAFRVAGGFVHLLLLLVLVVIVLRVIQGRA